MIMKMSDRLECWTSQHLSYAGRLQLIRSVLNTIHNYWASVFLLPSSIWQEIDLKCRTYLWGKKASGKSLALVNWTQVCRDKDHGGLGIRDSRLWNLAALAKQLWNIASKQDSLWIRWVDGIYLKGNDLWSYQVQPDVCWHWRKLMKVRDMFASSPLFATDQLNAGAVYTISKGYHWLLGPAPSFPLARAIWSRVVVPKHGFNLWLVVQNRLLTRDRLEGWRMIIPDSSCPLCETRAETNAHLFFACEYSIQVIRLICNWVGIQRLPLNRSSWLRWLQHLSSRLSVRHQVWIAAITAGVYHLWQARNVKIHGGALLDPYFLLLQVKKEVRARMVLVQRRKMTTADSCFLTHLLTN